MARWAVAGTALMFVIWFAAYRFAAPLRGRRGTYRTPLLYGAAFWPRPCRRNWKTMLSLAPISAQGVRLQVNNPLIDRCMVLGQRVRTTHQIHMTGDSGCENEPEDADQDAFAFTTSDFAGIACGAGQVAAQILDDYCRHVFVGRPTGPIDGVHHAVSRRGAKSGHHSGTKAIQHPLHLFEPPVVCRASQ